MKTIPSNHSQDKRRTQVKTSRNPTPNRTLPHCLLTMAFCIPLLAHACPKVDDDGRYPSQPIKNPALWRKQNVEEECGDHLRRFGRVIDERYDSEYGGVKVLYSHCSGGASNKTYDVFYPVGGSRTGLKYCAVGSVIGTGVWQLPSGPKGYVRIETYLRQSREEGDWTRYEVRPTGLIQIGEEHFLAP